MNIKINENTTLREFVKQFKAIPHFEGFKKIIPLKEGIIIYF